jgi:two-component system, LytTR family, sensor kinase
MDVITIFCRFILSKMKNKHTILIHAFFWLLAGSLNFSFIIIIEDAEPQFYFSQGVKTLLEALDFYLVYLILIPYFFNKKRLGLFAIVSSIYLCVFMLFYLFANNLADSFEGTIENLRTGKFPPITQFLSSTYYTVLYGFLGGLFRLAVEGFHSKQQKDLLEKQNAKNELGFLKSQINPHFLYNVLNTIHSYINSNNPNAAKAVIRLSDIMRYMLSDTNKKLITLQEEVDYLNSYIELQSYRLEKPDFVEFKIVGNYKMTLIPPLLLIPFVENAFKHGKKAVDPPGIRIFLEVSNEKLTFSLTNFINLKPEKLSRQGEAIGLTNAKRRLQLLYPGKHILNINMDEQKYSTTLELDLSI